MSLLKAFNFSKSKRKKRSGLDLGWGHSRKRKKRNQLAQAFGVGKKTKGGTALNSAFSRRRYSKASFTGVIANQIGKRGKRQKYAPGNIMSIVTGEDRGKQKKTKVPKGMLGLVGAVGYGLSRDDRLTPGEAATLAEGEARQTITDSNAKDEAVRSQDALERLAAWVRSRFKRADSA